MNPKENKFKSIFFDVVSDLLKSEQLLHNEAELQHEIGYRLRSRLKDEAKVYFERPVQYLNSDLKSKFVKKEIDLIVEYPNREQMFAIEIKAPFQGKFGRRGRHPETMYDFITDIQFLEEIRSSLGTKGYAIFFTNDGSYYDQKNSEGKIYDFFRSRKLITGKILKPTANEDKSKYRMISGEYEISWITGYGTQRCIVLEI